MYLIPYKILSSWGQWFLRPPPPPLAKGVGTKRLGKGKVKYTLGAIMHKIKQINLSALFAICKYLVCQVNSILFYEICRFIRIHLKTLYPEISNYTL